MRLISVVAQTSMYDDEANVRSALPLSADIWTLALCWFTRQDSFKDEEGGSISKLISAKACGFMALYDLRLKEL